MDLVILNHNQVKTMIPELETFSPNIPITPKGGCLSLDIFYTNRPLGMADLLGARLKVKKHQTRVRHLDQKGTAVTKECEKY
ncbi:hypothetical protein TNCV_3062151 [Trichonephila clavipes]|nr:hypothetical protein TNCV_3062151 [Trichonephila clavipes]